MAAPADEGRVCELIKETQRPLAYVAMRCAVGHLVKHEEGLDL
jgi:hypothetical protein